jgi:folate-binding protein YgfZ
MDEKAYQSAHQRAAFYVIPHAGCLQITGEDLQAFLQRQTTNDAAVLSQERLVHTVLTSPTGRILDVFYLLGGTQSIDVITLPGRGASTDRYLHSRIFFMDKVSVENVSARFAQIDLLGPQSAALVAGMGGPGLLEPDRLIRLSIFGAELRLWVLQPAFKAGFRMLLPAEALDLLATDLQSRGAARLGEPEYQTLRVEAGFPAADAELSDEYTPYEAGLSRAVSGEKGCYTGQEVLARQATYDKVTQRLRGLKLERPVEPGRRLHSEDGRLAGRLTSFALSPRFGPIGLAIVKRPFEEAGTRLALEMDEGEGQIAGEVVSLPF